MFSICKYPEFIPWLNNTQQELRGRDAAEITDDFSNSTALSEHLVLDKAQHIAAFREEQLLQQHQNHQNQHPPVGAGGGALDDLNFSEPKYYLGE